MPSQSLTLSVRPRGKPLHKLPEEVAIIPAACTQDLYNELARKSHTSVHRLRITKGSDGALVPNSKDVLVSTTGLRQDSSIYVKDLGPQIPWRTVFLVEYLGPLLIHPILYAFLPKTANRTVEPTFLQTCSLLMVLAHFGKREFETLFIHRFSSSTMPAFNIIKNSAHYWVLSGLNMAYWIYRPDSAAAGPVTNSTYPIAAIGLSLFVVGEVGNLIDHLVLRNLRSSGGTERGIPQGLGFNLVTCPNYMFETLAWTGIALVSWSWSTVLFAVVAMGQMGVWAQKKESRYRKEFGGKYIKKRSVMLPGIW